MGCAFAFLLAATGRMVITGSNYNDRHYGLYNVLPTHKFPEPVSNTEVYLFTQKKTSSGTNYAMYCSPTKSMSEIVQNIQGLSTQGIQAESITPGHSQMMQKCLQKIRSSKDPLLSELLPSKKKDSPCTSSIIFDLVIMQQIKLVGNNYFPLPMREINAHKISADTHMALKDVLPRGSMLLTASKNKKDKALVWYNGRLILLRGSKEKSKRYWAPHNNIDDVWGGIDCIIEFMTDDFPDTTNIIRKFNYMSDYVRTFGSIERSESNAETLDSGDVYRKFVDGSRGSLQQSLFEATPEGYV
ncbi:Bgt-50673 [Blumeria graminis f. sp. tritici]|uniref:Bgt-50673 n=2 Tax=Blumeria graminis f. sp. tritici TaxID=62690 RepID=A0A9X9PQX5_BLUGR|nr:Bgt-50673 [Blumeria graminis f. sp. tritici]